MGSADAAPLQPPASPGFHNPFICLPPQDFMQRTPQSTRFTVSPIAHLHQKRPCPPLTFLGFSMERSRKALALILLALKF